MKLEDSLEAMASLLAGRASSDATAGRLGIEAHGLSFYARLAKMARESLLSGMFPHSRHAVVVRSSEERWRALVEEYFEKHPERRFVRHLNAAAFPAFLGAIAAAPPWLGEIADLEWHEWQAEIAARDPSDDDPDQGPLRVASTLRLRSYAHDVVGWIDEAEREGDPARVPVVCAFWQDRDALSFRNALSSRHLEAIEAVRATAPLDREVLEELRSADIVVGIPTSSRG